MECEQIHDHIRVNYRHDILIYQRECILCSEAFPCRLLVLTEARMFHLNLIDSYLNLATREYEINLIVRNKWENTLIAIGFERDFSI